MKKIFKIFIIMFIIFSGMAIYTVLQNPDKYNTDNNTAEDQKTQYSKYVIDSLSTYVGNTPSINWSDYLEWTDEQSGIVNVKGTVKYNEEDVQFSFRFAGDDCVHYSVNGNTFVSDIDKEAAWMDEHNKK